MSFFKSFIKELINKGNIVDIATNENNGDTAVPECYREWGCRVFNISCSRSPFKIGNIKAIKEIRGIVQDNGYDIVHCHTPIAAFCTRLACKSFRKKGTKVLYTAHGFHFYKGAPLKNWLVFYPIEKMCSRWTDVLITINTEDYALAKKSFWAKRTEYVPGVGIDTAFFSEKRDRQKIRKEFGIPDNRFLLLSVGELNSNKNHEAVIKAISGLDITYIIVGKGDLFDYLKDLAEKVGSNVILTGYRSDVVDFYATADAYILPSKREGLNVSLMEAMASGIPCLASNIRGNVDLISDDELLFDPNKITSIRHSINRIIFYDKSFDNRIIKKLDNGYINKMMFKIYESI